MYSGNVVDMAGRAPQPEVKEYAVLFRLEGDDVQFKLFGQTLGRAERRELAEALEASARRLRE